MHACVFLTRCEEGLHDGPLRAAGVPVRPPASFVQAPSRPAVGGALGMRAPMAAGPVRPLAMGAATLMRPASVVRVPGASVVRSRAACRTACTCVHLCGLLPRCVDGVLTCSCTSRGRGGCRRHRPAAAGTTHAAAPWTAKCRVPSARVCPCCPFLVGGVEMLWPRGVGRGGIRGSRGGGVE